MPRHERSAVRRRCNVGPLGVKVSVTDLGGLAASETFNIVVATTPNTPPTAVADLADATEKGGMPTARAARRPPAMC